MTMTIVDAGHRVRGVNPLLMAADTTGWERCVACKTAVYTGRQFWAFGRHAAGHTEPYRCEVCRTREHREAARCAAEGDHEPES